MLEQNRNLLSASSHEQVVTLVEGQTPDLAYQQWLAKLLEAEQCRAHSRTAPSVAPGKNWEQDYDQSWGKPKQLKPGVYCLFAQLSCPACRLAFARCPPEFHETSFATFDTSARGMAHHLALCREYVAQANQKCGGFLVMVGLPGTGKTRLACNVIQARDCTDSLYVRQGELTIALRASYQKQPLEYDEFQRPIDRSPLTLTQRAGLLVLDEIGCTAIANDEQRLLDELLKHRYDHRKPTILISNLPLTTKHGELDLKEFLGDALTDRINQATGHGRFILQFSGESYRKRPHHSSPAPQP